MSVTSELRRRVRAGRSQSRYEPCVPSPAKHPPAGSGWIHEIKHDGIRILAQRDAHRIRLLTRNGVDFAERFPLVVAAVAELPARSCVVDGEAIACDEKGLSVFERIRWRRHDNAVTLCAFDLLELDGEDLRREPIEVRKATLKGLVRDLEQALRSIAISKTTALSFTNRPARSAARASFPSGSARRTNRAARRTG
jgi:ATP-dependent DNA ligase